jgi:hypothetical protein
VRSIGSSGDTIMRLFVMPSRAMAWSFSAWHHRSRCRSASCSDALANSPAGTDRCSQVRTHPTISR